MLRDVRDYAAVLDFNIDISVGRGDIRGESSWTGYLSREWNVWSSTISQEVTIGAHANIRVCTYNANNGTSSDADVEKHSHDASDRGRAGVRKLEQLHYIRPNDIYQR